MPRQQPPVVHPDLSSATSLSLRNPPAITPRRFWGQRRVLSRFAMAPLRGREDVLGALEGEELRQELDGHSGGPQCSSACRAWW